MTIQFILGFLSGILTLVFLLFLSVQRSKKKQEKDQYQRIEQIQEKRLEIEQEILYQLTTLNQIISNK